LDYAKWWNRFGGIKKRGWNIRHTVEICNNFEVVKTHSLQQQEETDSTRNVRGEVQTKTTFQRSAKVVLIYNLTYELHINPLFLS
jgi:hypothetical protein